MCIRELHRFVDASRSAVVLYETAYEIPSAGYRQRALTGVAYVHEGGRWLAVADQGSATDQGRPDHGLAVGEQPGVKR